MTTALASDPLWDELSSAERFAIWTIRHHLAERAAPWHAVSQVHLTFANMGAADALRDLDRLMALIAGPLLREARRVPLHEPRLSRAEGMLLDALALGQTGGVVDGLLTLRPLLDPQECRAASRACADYAAALGEAGLDLTVRLRRRVSSGPLRAEPASQPVPTAPLPLERRIVR
jgi:hypothetical protein